MAEKIVRNAEKTAETAQKTAGKAAGTAKKTAQKVVEAEKKAEKNDKGQTVIQAKPSKGKSMPYRIGAFVLWALAIVCEVLAIMILLNYFYVPNKILFLIIAIVLDMALAIIAAQLWKKANHIKPFSEKNKFLFYLGSELGVIMACICFIPLIVMLLKNKELDKKTKAIVTAVAGAALLITGLASADWHPISQEQLNAAEEQITSDVYWTEFGHKYHLDEDCGAIKNSNTLYRGTVTEAVEAGRTALCSFCAKRHADELDLDALNVENRDAVAESVTPNETPGADTTAAPED